MPCNNGIQQPLVTYSEKKRGLRARIDGIQRCLARNHNPHLILLEEQLIKEYESICDQEALYWQQKSKDKWLKEGDKNTKFFHLTTLLRRRRNKIEGLVDENGIFSSNAQIMKNIDATYFKNLFSESATNDSDFAIPIMFPALETHDLNWIKRGVSATEVKNTVFGIGGLKAPGSDGFPAIFYQKH